MALIKSFPSQYGVNGEFNVMTRCDVTPLEDRVHVLVSTWKDKAALEAGSRPLIENRSYMFQGPESVENPKDYNPVRGADTPTANLLTVVQEALRRHSSGDFADATVDDSLMV